MVTIAETCVQGNYLEFENLVGEPLREGIALGVSMPTLKVIYEMCKAIQWRTKEKHGLTEAPPRKES
jgi:ketopantoate reductase